MRIESRITHRPQGRAIGRLLGRGRQCRLRADRHGHDMARDDIVQLPGHRLALSAHRLGPVPLGDDRAVFGAPAMQLRELVRLRDGHRPPVVGAHERAELHGHEERDRNRRVRERERCGEEHHRRQRERGEEARTRARRGDEGGGPEHIEQHDQGAQPADREQVDGEDHGRADERQHRCAVLRQHENAGRERRRQRPPRGEVGGEEGEHAPDAHESERGSQKGEQRDEKSVCGGAVGSIPLAESLRLRLVHDTHATMLGESRHPSKG
ncbi:hypothetical protein SRABI03_03180 [Microbacterium foliorum]|nr:hypothetical protein SRABI03_03180 [Microbacterium foliorum]